MSEHDTPWFPLVPLAYKGAAWGGTSDKKVGRICTMTDGAVKPWPKWKIDDARNLLPLEFNSDAHFTPAFLIDRKTGKPETLGGRIRQGIWPQLEQLGLDVRLACLPFDLDDPVAHAKEEPASEDWRKTTLDLLATLRPELHDTMGWYMTRGGMRLIWLLWPWLDVPNYVGVLRAVRVELHRHGIFPDPLLDWVRVYRFPDVRRKGVRQVYPKNFDNLSVLQWRPPGGTTRARIDARSGCTIVLDGEKGRTTAPKGALSDSDKARGPAPAPKKYNALEHLTEPLQFEAPLWCDEMRNRTMFGYACSLREQGWTKKDVQEEIFEYYDSACSHDPPMSTRELEQIVASAFSYARKNTYVRGTPRPQAATAEDDVDFATALAKLRARNKIEVPGNEVETPSANVEASAIQPTKPRRKPKPPPLEAPVLTPEQEARLMAHQQAVRAQKHRDWFKKHE